jgi:hypothetical protein
MKSTLHQRIEVGSRVMFARQFLRNTCQFIGEAPFIEGTVESIGAPLDKSQGEHSPRLIKVLWDGDKLPTGALSVNLVRKEDRHLELP